MAFEVTHAFQSGKSDGSDATLVQPSNWNEAHDVTMATSRILGRISGGAGAVEELTVANVWTFLGIVATTAVLFAQAAAPTGWTKATTHNNKALRLVTGGSGGSAGGTTPFTSVFTSRTIAEANLPSHTHGPGTLTGTISGTTSEDGDHNHTIGNAGGTTNRGQDATQAANSNTATTTTNGDHTHTVSGTCAISGGTTASAGSGTAMDFAVQYVDVIIATKD